MADKTAKIVIGVEGAEEATAAIQRVGGAWSNAGKAIKSTAGEMASTVGASLKSVASDIARTITVAKTINFGSAIESSKAFRAQVAQIGIAGRQSFDQVEASLDKIGAATLQSKDQVGAWQGAIGKLTKNYEFASAAQQALAEHAIAFGQSAGDMAGFADALNQIGVEGKDVTDFIGTLEAQANKLGNVGGVRALEDRFVSLRDTIDDMTDGTAGSQKKMTAFLGGFGAGLSEKAQTKVAGQALGLLEANQGRGVEQVIGHGLKRDDMGRIVDAPGALAEYRQKLTAQYGKQGAYQILRRYGGDVFARTMTKGDFGQSATDLAANNTDAATVAGFKGTNEGIDQDNERRRRNAELGVGKSLADAQRPLAGLMADHPVSSLVGSAVGGNVASTAFGKLTTFLTGGGSAAGSGGAAAAGDGAAALNSVSAIGAGGGAGMLALSGGVMLAGIAAQLKVLTEVGQDRDSMGADWRHEHGDLIAGEEALKKKAPKFGGIGAIGSALSMGAGDASGDIAAMIQSLVRNGQTPEDARAAAAAFADAMHKQPLRVIVAGTSAPPAGTPQ